MIRIGILGYGNLGKYLYEELSTLPNFEIAFIWNRTRSKLIDDKIPAEKILENISDLENFNPKADLIIEVAQNILENYAEVILKHADVFIGSPTALAKEDVEKIMKNLCAPEKYARRVYIGRGALYGAEDIRIMAESGSLKALKITMTKDPSHLHVQPELIPLRDQAAKTNQKTILYEGPVRNLCPLAPKNVNTMATASFAASNLGLDKVTGCLVADPNIGSFHQVLVECFGPEQADGRQFKVTTDRMNPAPMGEVTGRQTYIGFLSSVKRACLKKEEVGKFHVI